MQFTVITLFPEFVENIKNYSIIGRAIKEKKIDIKTINLRDFGIGRYKQVDDKPYGGGPGMLLRVDIMSAAIKSAKKLAPKAKVVLLSPEGKTFNQKTAFKYAKSKNIILVCGHYEGFDERVKKYVDEVVSVGNYILSGGELPAMAIIDSISRLIPGVLGNSESLKNESFSSADNCKLAADNSFDFPQYTRPEVYKGEKVPEVLISGNHKEIEKWRHNMTLK
jgi:tRNA (guanine37-N1)-methyltransferase